MLVFVRIGDPQLQSQVVHELTLAGLETATGPDHTLPEGVTATILDDLDLIPEFSAQGPHVLALIPESDVGATPPQLSDFVVLPMHPGELPSRIRALASRPSPGFMVRAKLQALAVERASDIIEVTTPRAEWEYVNPAFERTLGFSRDQVVGKTPGSLIRSDAHDRAFFQELEQTLGRGDVWRGVMISKARDGRMIHLDSTITPIFDDYGTMIHHVGVKRDITERVAREQALRETNAALEKARDAALAASKTKSEFLANMSHELRTPLNAIIGYAELLLEDHEDDAETSRDLSRIRLAGRNLLELINDVLDISKIEADKIELQIDLFDVAELVDVIQSTVEPLVEKNSNRFVVEHDGAIDQLETDRLRLRQILLNLLSNAAKFTHQGTITLRIRPDPADPTWVKLDVADTGVGIKTEDQERLFEPFEQADGSTTREHGGTGLGLTITRRLAEKMGGEVTLHSVVGEGSTFSVRLPVASTGPVQRAIESHLDAEGRLVLLVDDDPATQDMVSRALRRRGLQVEVVGTGEEGLHFARLHQPDVVLLDVNLPGISGWEVLSELKLSERTVDIPVVMLTVEMQQEVGHSLGAVDYLHKPVQGDQLGRAILRHVRDAPARVLVVEDDEPTRELVRRTLESSGHTVLEAEHGRAALDTLDRIGPEEEAPDVVVLDLMMPVMDGFEFLRRLRGHPIHADLPVLIATARVLSEGERDELTRMARKIVEKNAYTRQELLDQIDRHVIGALR